MGVRILSQIGLWAAPTEAARAVASISFRTYQKMAHERLMTKEFVQKCCGKQGSAEGRNCINPLHYRLTRINGGVLARKDIFKLPLVSSAPTR